MSKGTENIWNIYQDQIKTSAEILNIGDEELENFLNPDNTIEKNLEIDLDNGERKNFPAYRIQFNRSLGPYKGGVRFAPEADLEEVKALAGFMSIKTALLDLPLGGGKGGVIVDTKKLSSIELEKLSRAWVNAMHEDIGQNKDIPAPDMYTNSDVMAVMLDEFENIKEESQPGAFTGKPLELGGILLRNKATALGGFMVLKNFLKKRGLDYKTVAIQGFGNAGSNAALFLKKEGFTICGLSDSSTALYSETGLDPEQILNFKKEKMSLKDIFENKKDHLPKDVKELNDKDNLLKLGVDILIPAAYGGVIGSENMDDVSAKLILELSNGPISKDADRILNKKKIEVLPDILANAGGVTVSYFEWIQNKTGQVWKEQKVRLELEEKMKFATEKIINLSEEKKISLREAAFILGVEKILKATRFRKMI